MKRWRNPNERYKLRGESYTIICEVSLTFRDAKGTCAAGYGGVSLGFRTFRGVRQSFLSVVAVSPEGHRD